VAHPAEGY